MSLIDAGLIRVRSDLGYPLYALGCSKQQIGPYSKACNEGIIVKTRWFFL